MKRDLSKFKRNLSLAIDILLLGGIMFMIYRLLAT
tara:strand:+ start:199 stop:303 length:105 start_codon:yes stop_codon:yes gene_type:complete